MPNMHAMQQNRLLAVLPAAVLSRIAPHLDLVPMPLGMVVCESGGSARHVFFPTDCIVSLQCMMESGTSSEIAVVGNDGLIGIALFMSGASTTARAVVKSAGQAYRLMAQAFHAEFNRYAELMHLSLRYTQCLITQMAQTSVCNRHHSIDQQFCRGLLLSLDRLPGNVLAMTHESIANVLGVRREGISEAAGRLQKLGIIEYTRGRITVLDRPRLEAQCCECYAVVKQETDRLFHSLCRQE